MKEDIKTIIEMAKKQGITDKIIEYAELDRGVVIRTETKGPFDISYYLHPYDTELFIPGNPLYFNLDSDTKFKRV